MTSQQFHESSINETFDLLYTEKLCIELRALGVPGSGVISGYFDNKSAFCDSAMEVNGKAKGVYVTLNPVKLDLLSRAPNRLTPHAKSTTADKNIAQRNWLLIDADPARPSDVSSTNEESDDAKSRIETVEHELARFGFPPPVMADSGNGVHLLYRIDLPNDRAATDLVQNVLRELDFCFSDRRIVIDTTVGNPARITKLYGTKARKGEDSPDRPHRVSRITSNPETYPVPTDLLRRLASRYEEKRRVA